MEPLCWERVLNDYIKTSYNFNNQILNVNMEVLGAIYQSSYLGYTLCRE